MRWNDEYRQSPDPVGTHPARLLSYIELNPHRFLSPGSLGVRDALPSPHPA
jgi:hypothetical protein